jgi:type II secretory pathway pseudopilin PulG
MKQNKFSFGFTFVELILAVVVLGIAIPPLLQVAGNLSLQAVQGDVVPTAASLGNNLMEEIKSRRWDELLTTDNTQGNWSDVMSIDAGEDATDESTLDDVDDFNGWTKDFSANYTGYTASVVVSYVDETDLNTPVVIPSLPLSPSWTPGFKRIVITISNSSLSGGSIQIIGLVGPSQTL